MIKSIYSAAQNMRFKMKDIEVIANNLANINTTGYKRELPFAEVLSRAENKNTKQLTDFSEGVAITTGNPLDLSIKGIGFFVLQTDGGDILTRSGKFMISEDGYLSDEKGNKVLGQKGAINLSDILLDQSTTVKISADGEVRIGEKIIDKLLVAKIDDQKNLIRTQDQGFAYEDGDFETADESGYNIFQGYIEESNVNPIQEMQSMIEINRDFESTQKMIVAFDNFLGKVNESGKV
ncbi:MAG: flagellar hook-basal body protein [Ignavibacteriales bacterium]|nr:flagellar hook-basal body protein [Ignavibacteriales bacterium]